MQSVAKTWISMVCTLLYTNSSNSLGLSLGAGLAVALGLPPPLTFHRDASHATATAS